jgi:predicted ATPase
MPTVEAEARLRHAADIARRQQPKALELRSVISMSRLWRQQGEREQARQLLAEIYGRFTERFATADLRKVKPLLEALG